MTSSTNGKSWESSTQPSATVPMRVLKRARAYAAGSATSTVRIAEASETCRLLSAARPSACSVKACT
jgi:hypothetical protein